MDGTPGVTPVSVPPRPSLPPPLIHNHDHDGGSVTGEGSVKMPSSPIGTHSSSDGDDPFRMDPIRPLLQSLACYPRDFAALRGPSARSQSKGPSSGIDDSMYSLPLSQPQTKLLYRRLYSRLFESTYRMHYFWPPAPASSTNEPSSELSLEEALNLLEANHWSLSRAQGALPAYRAQQAAKLASANLSLKGKSPASTRANSPLPTIDTAAQGFLGPEYTPARKGRPCGHYFRKGEAIWRCRDCALDDTCVQCAPCFEASVHNAEDHDVVFSVCATEGGVCDCGDVEAWRKETGCRYHSKEHVDLSEESMEDGEQGQRRPTAAFVSPDSIDRTLKTDINNALEATGVDGEFIDGLNTLLSEWIDFVLATLDHAPDEQTLFFQSFSLFNQKHAQDLIWNQEDLETWSSRYDTSTKANEDSDAEEEGLTPYLGFEEDVEASTSTDDEHGRGGTSYRSQHREQAKRTVIPAFKRRLREIRRLRREGKIPSDSRLHLAAPFPADRESGHAPPGGYPLDDNIWDRSNVDMSAAFSADPVFDDGELERRIAKVRKEDVPTKPLRTWPLKPRKYALLLWNDERHTFKDVIDTVKEAIGVSDEEARAVADRVDTHGKDILLVSDLVEELVNAARRMGGINLKVTIRPAFDVYCEEIASQLMWILKDLAEATIYIPHGVTASSVIPDSTVLPCLITGNLLQEWPLPCRHEESFFTPQMEPDAFDGNNLKKLDGLLLMDYKVWKEGRSWLRQLWLNLCKVSPGRRGVASHCAFSYNKIIETFIFRDREPEYSLILLTVQLFSVPSVATELVSKYDFLRRLHRLLNALMTGGSLNATKQLEIPPRHHRGLRPVEDGQHPRLMATLRHILYDIKYLIQAPGVQQLIVHDPQNIDYLLDWLSHFNAYAAEVRETQQHVEFDGETWIIIFQVCQLLAKEAQLYGQAYQKASHRQAHQALNYTVARIHYETTLQSNQIADDDDSEPQRIPPLIFSDVAYGDYGATYRIIEFDVASQRTAFHHPMHWFMAELSKRICSFSPSDLASLGADSVPALISSLDEDGLLIVFDMSIRCIVKIAQVRHGMWVRNGTATRSQAAHYKDVIARVTMYDQDVFLMQVALAILPSPDRFLATLVDRFGLSQHLNPSLGANEVSRERTESLNAVEDLLLLLITLFSEPGNACAWGMDRFIRRELIQFLALGQGTFTSTTRSIPEYMIDHPIFEKILTQVTTFREPDGTTDQGIFDLKDECYNEVDPFFYHYSRNQRERAEEQLCLREKKAGRSPEKLVLVPSRQLSGEGQVFANSILRGLTAPSFAYILFAGLGNPRSVGDTINETQLEMVIRLIMIGIVETGDHFVDETLLRPLLGNKDISILADLCELEPRVKSDLVKASLSWCLDQSQKSGKAKEVLMARRMGGSKGVLGGGNAQRPATGKKSLEARKAAAKARQAAIMQKFSAQQKTLLESLEKDAAGSDSKEAADDSMEVDVKGEETTMKRSDDEDDGAELEEAMGSCIMCQEQLGQDKSFVRLGLLTASRVLRTTPRNNARALKDVVEVPLNLDRVSPTTATNGRMSQAGKNHSSEETPFNPLTNLGTSGGGFSKEENKSGILASSCGHMMHITCFHEYYRNVQTRHSQQIARNHAENLGRLEFVCPLCKSLGNVILPVPRSSRKAQPSSSLDSPIGHQILDPTPIGDWLRKINIDILKTSGSQSISGVQDGTHGGTGCFVAWYADNILSWFLDRDPSIKLPGGTLGSLLVMLGRLADVLPPLSAALRPQRVAWQAKTILAPPGSRKMYLPDELVGYTLSLLEVSHRGLDAKGTASGSVATAISDGSLALLRSLIFCLKGIVATEQLNDRLPAATRQNYPAALRQGLMKRLLPHWSSDEAVRSPLLLRNPLSILVEAAAIVPESFGQVATLMYYATLVQTVFGLAQPSIWPQTGSGGGSAAGRTHLSPPVVSEDEKAALREIFPDVRWTVGHIVGFVGYARGNITLGVDGLDDLTLTKMICTYTLPFLRRAAILQRVICGDSTTPSPTAADSARREPLEYVRLLSELNIVPPSQGLPSRAERQSAISSIVEGWIKHAYNPLASLFRPLPINPSPLGGLNDSTSLSVVSPPNHPTLQLEHPHIYELITLPKDLTVLLQYAQRTICKKCKTSPPEPALCLLCGEVICYQSYCCMDDTLQRGECNLHISTCGGNYGIFFKVKTNLVFLLYHTNGTFIYSPYLDSHGEVDVGLQKGRRQTLYQKRYDELRKIWLGGGVGTLVARKTEASMDPGGWETT